MYLYVIATQNRNASGLTGPIKVGVTTSLRSRLAALQTGSSRKLLYHQAWDFSECPKAARRFEGAFHNCQSAAALAGEWFGMDPGKAAFLIEFYFNLAARLDGYATERDGYLRNFGVIGRQYHATGEEIVGRA